MKKIKFLALLMAVIMMFATISIFAEGEDATPTAGEEAGENTPSGEEAGDEDTDPKVDANDDFLRNDPCYIVDLSKVSERSLVRMFQEFHGTDIERVEDGVKFSAPSDTSDPGVYWTINTMFSIANCPARTDVKGKNYIPFTADEVEAIVFKIRSVDAGDFELFYTTAANPGITGDCRLACPYEGSENGDEYEYIIFDAFYEFENWEGVFGKTFRLDWAADALEGQYIVISEIAFIDTYQNAERYIAGEPFVYDDGDDNTDTDPIDEDQTTTEATPVETTAVVNVETTAVADIGKPGCKSVVTGAAVLVASIALAGVALSKKH